MFVGFGRFDVLVGPHDSRKAKRAVVRRLVSDLQKKFAVSAAETDYHDLWQRTEVAVSVVSNGHGQCQQVLETCEQFIADIPEFELLSARLRVISDDDV